MIDQVKSWLRRRKMLTVQDFAHQHKNYLVIVCDPKDDTIFVSYRDRQIAGRIQSEDGVEYNVVKNVLRHSKFEGTIDRFMGGLIFALGIPLKNPFVNEFLSFLDGALFRITKSLKFKSKK